MRLLADHELVPLLDPQNNNRIIHGVLDPGAWTTRDSTIQPSSVDLHVGNIVFPGVKIGKDGSTAAPKTTGQLDPGETAIVTTHERVELPANLAAIGFPPTSVSARGVLMTNPGHIDPGFNGHLQFTLINMGKSRYCLEENQSIVTLLIFELDGGGATHSYAVRNDPDPKQVPSNEEVDRLAPDFFDFKKRSEEIAKKVSREAKLWSGLLAVFVAIISAVFGTIQNLESTRFDEEVASLSKEISTLESNFKTDDRLKKLEIRPDLAPRVQQLENNQTLQNEVKKFGDKLKAETDQVRTDGATEDSRLRQELKELREVLDKLQKQESDASPPTNTEASLTL